MSVYTTEIASDKIPSDNPIHQRLLKAYIEAKPFIKGNVLEPGCGEGRGIGEIAPLARQYTGIDKIESVVNRLRSRYPAYRFEAGSFPPIPFPDKSFDTVVSFQVIEHVKKDRRFLEEIYRVLTPGGKAILTTPNRKMTLTRNPWHIREYTAHELASICEGIFPKVDMKGIAGNDKVMEYYERNRESVKKITKYDVLKLQYRLPSSLLRVPYDILNRINRNSLKDSNDTLVTEISHEDYFLAERSDKNLDLFVILEK